MIGLRIRVLHLHLKVIDLLLLPLSFFLAFYLRFHSGAIPVFGPLNVTAYMIYFAIAWLTWIGLMNYLRLEDVEYLENLRGWVGQATLATGLIVAGLTVLPFFYRSYEYSRVFTLLFGSLQLLFLALSRIVIKHVLALSATDSTSRILLVEWGNCGNSLVKQIERSVTLPAKVVGHINLTNSDLSPSNLPSETGRTMAIEIVVKAIATADCDEVFVVTPVCVLDRLEALLSYLKGVDLPVRLVLPDLQKYCNPYSVVSFNGLPVANLMSYPSEEIHHLYGKRVFDVSVSLIVLIIGLPVYIAIALAVCFTSGRPVFFGQERVGLNGKRFRMYKFRTMNVGSIEEAVTRWTTADDSRVTQFGKWLRRFNLDELPQFFNVLRGDMSLVGPRPERPYFVQLFSERFLAYRKRHHLRVGITGWAQVNGLRGDTPIDKRLEYDLHYLNNWSLWFDIKILFLTLVRSFRDPSAY